MTRLRCGGRSVRSVPSSRLRRKLARDWSGIQSHRREFESEWRHRGNARCAASLISRRAVR